MCNPQSADPNFVFLFNHAGLASLSGLQLTRLDLRDCEHITDLGLAQLEGMPLTDLDLAGRRADAYDDDLGNPRGFTPAGLAHLGGMPLRRLILEDSEILKGANPEDLAPLVAMPLTELSLQATKIQDAGLAVLRNLPLTHLDLGYCKGLTGAGLEALSGMPLKTLNLEFFHLLAGGLARGCVTCAASR